MVSSSQSNAPHGLRLLEAWAAAKHVSWPASWAKTMIRVPLPSGRYVTKSLPPRLTERETLAACIAERDRIGVAIWGAKRWREMMAVSKRSVVKHRQDRPTPRTGVQLDDRPGRAPCWVASWYEPESGGVTLPDQPGKRAATPRRKRSKSFSFGSPHARFSSSEAAYAEAVALREAMERRWYSVVAPLEESRVNHHPDESTEETTHG
jgi:hypothetical protein